MKILLSATVIGLLLLMSGCKSTIPMPTYQDQVIATNQDNNNTMESVEKSILRAAISLGWKPKKVADGKIEATLDIRTHQLVVLLDYDVEKISVQYVDSTNLKYNGSRIHRQYANWVNNLLRAVNANNVVG